MGRLSSYIFDRDAEDYKLLLQAKRNELIDSGLANGSTSLEGFHHHIVTFVPGISANAVHFQAYLLDGIAWWNSSRKQDALDVCKTSIRSDVKMVAKVN